MKNIHILPTDKPSRLIVYSELLKEFRLLDEPIDFWNHTRSIYITSDGKLKLRDYIVLDNSIEGLPDYQGLHVIQILDDTLLRSAIALGCKKITLATDPDLLAEGIQDIDDDFLEWFVKNPSCEYVEVQCSGRNCIEEFGCTKEVCNGIRPLKIIIPQEEHELVNAKRGRYEMKETLKEGYARMLKPDLKPFEIFELGAKWQSEQDNWISVEERYGESEVLNILYEWSMYKVNLELEKLADELPNIMSYDEWFKQYKITHPPKVKETEK